MIAAWLSVFFRLANFGVLIALVVYVYKNYLHGYITEKIEHEQTIDQGLRNERDVAHRIYNEYKERVARKGDQRVIMQQTIMQWQEAVARDDAQRVGERTKITQSLKLKAEHQVEQMRSLVVKHSVLPEALVRAHNQLEMMYSSEKKGIDFMQRIVAHLQESKS